ncbi:Hypothetical predicted protein, partial [Paramuricea clavata]
KSNELDEKQLLTKQVDSLALLGHISYVLACLRRYKIKSVLKPEYASICVDDGTQRKYMFGDDLPKRLKDAKEASNVGLAVNTSNSRTNNYRGPKSYDQRNWRQTRGGHNYHGGSSRSDFPSEENRTTRGKWCKIPTTSQEIIAHLKTINSSVSPVSKWKISIPILKDYLKQLCASSKAGRISIHFSAWISITSDKEILSDTQGMTIELSEMPAQHPFVQTKFNSAETEIIETEINKMLGKEIIEQVERTKDEIISNIFTRPKKDGTHRVIIYLKDFNKHVSYYHFKMD